MATNYIYLPGFGDVHWSAPVANFAALPATDTTYAVRLAEDTGTVYYYNGSAWVTIITASAFSGILAVANGGTNSGSALANGKAMISAAGAIVESGTSAAELGYLVGVSSAIQAQLDAKEATITTLPVSKGGTNSNTALNSNRFVVSSGGKIVEAAAIAANKAIVSDTNGLPVASATSDAELAFVSGVTSAIQTQLNAKEPTLAAGTTAQYYRGDKSWQALNVAALTAIVDGSSGATTHVNELLQGTSATPITTNVGSTGVYGYATSVAVTAGRWLVWASVQFKENAAVLTDAVQAGISASTTGSGLADLDTVLYNAQISGSSDSIFQVPMQVISIAAPATYYLNTKFTYTSGTPKHAGKINFLRIG